MRDLQSTLKCEEIRSACKNSYFSFVASVFPYFRPMEQQQCSWIRSARARGQI